MAPVQCVIPLCTKTGTLTFPKNETRRAEWIRVIEHNLKPGTGLTMTIRRHSRICADHFKPSDFSRTANMSRKSLKKTAVPSVFPWSSNDSSSQSCSYDEKLKLSVTNVQETYARVPPIVFVEEQVHMNMTEDYFEDPLKFSSSDEDSTSVIESYEKLDYENLENHTDSDDNVAVELEISTQEEILQLECSTMVNKYVQTQDDIGCGFTIHQYKNDDKSIHTYTGLENFNKVMLVFNTLGQCAFKLKYFYGSSPQNLDALEQFFITLLILRRHESMELIAAMYRVSVKQIYDIFITWIRFMSLQWRNLDLWVPRKNVKEHMPFDFYDKYPSTRVILDATECPIKKPKLPFAQQVTFSSYKNKNTIKFLVGITPSGFISFVSHCYGGSATDRQLIERSSILTRFNYNDEIMVDKGLNVQDIFLPYGVKVNMPAFFKKGNQIAPQTLRATRRVASKRVHVERVIGLMKTYKILSQPLNQTETVLSSDIVFVCAILTNFRSSIINKYF